MLKDWMPGMGPKPPAAQPEDDGRLRPNGQGGFTYTLPKMVPDERPVAQGQSPYDMVGGGQYGNMFYAGMPRYKADLERRKAEAEAERAEMELEYQRWMMEQARRNPYGMNIRDLLSRIK